VLQVLISKENFDLDNLATGGAKSMKGVHNAFHISGYGSILHDPEYNITIEPILTDQVLTFELCP
jgi:hypothetical protein